MLQSPPTPTMLSLYKLALKRLVQFVPLEINFDSIVDAVTDDVMGDFYVEVQRAHEDSEDVRIILQEELSDPFRAAPLLTFAYRRKVLHKLFNQHLRVTWMNLLTRMSSKLRTAYDLIATSEKILKFVAFYVEAGWYEPAEAIIRSLLTSIKNVDRDNMLRPRVEALELKCKVILLHVLSSFAKLKEANELYEELSKVSEPSAELCAELSRNRYLMSDYARSAHWSVESLRLLLTEPLQPTILINVLRQGSRAFVAVRKFKKARLCIEEAVLTAKNLNGTDHPTFADIMTDYGYFLINSDAIDRSLLACQTAYETRLSWFGDSNLKVAEALEDLGYASYVKEYKTGHFQLAIDYAKRALRVMEQLLPPNHLHLASAQRVVALILEEISVGQHSTKAAKRLKTAERLHINALRLSINAYGELNVQTSKHYGNLGRLYQTMKRFEDSENMHLKAIQIKEAILGPNDPEVALSIGHLASLYNYDMNEFDKAEPLYLRSVAVTLNLHGPGHSGLEYDYSGLIRIYKETQDYASYAEFRQKLSQWSVTRMEIRDQEKEEEGLPTHSEARCVSELIADVVRNESH